MTQRPNDPSPLRAPAVLVAVMAVGAVGATLVWVLARGGYVRENPRGESLPGASAAPHEVRLRIEVRLEPQSLREMVIVDSEGIVPEPRVRGSDGGAKARTRLPATTPSVSGAPPAASRTNPQPQPGSPGDVQFRRSWDE